MKSNLITLPNKVFYEIDRSSRRNVVTINNFSAAIRTYIKFIAAYYAWIDIIGHTYKVGLITILKIVLFYFLYTWFYTFVMRLPVLNRWLFPFTVGDAMVCSIFKFTHFQKINSWFNSRSTLRRTKDSVQVYEEILKK